MAARCLVDSNCLVAAMCDWHEHHQATLSDMRRRARSGQELVVASHSLVETYAVLTRLPEPWTIEPRTALVLIEDNWGSSTAIALTSAECRSLLREAGAASVRGGQIYDAIVAACAAKARVRTILTWNVRHFARYAHRFEVLTPRAQA